MSILIDNIKAVHERNFAYLQTPLQQGCDYVNSLKYEYPPQIESLSKHTIQLNSNLTLVFGYSQVFTVIISSRGSASM